MSDHRNQGSYTNSMKLAATNKLSSLYNFFFARRPPIENADFGSDVDGFDHLGGSFHGSCDRTRKEDQTTKVIGVCNQGDATFNYTDEAKILVHASCHSIGSRVDPLEPSLQLLSNNFTRPTNSNYFVPAAAAVVNQGGQTVINNPTFHVEASTNEAKENPIQRISKLIHQNTWIRTCIDMGETLRADDIPDTLPEIHPQMARWPQFYKGERAESKHLKQKKKVKGLLFKDPEYRKDPKLTFQGPEYEEDPTFPFYDNDEIKNLVPLSFSTETIISKINELKDKHRVLGVIAQAGAGKSTCMRRWARRTMRDSGIVKENQFRSSKDKRFQLIHFIDMKRVRNSQESYVPDVLFQDLEKSDRKVIYDWLIQNQDKVVIFLDGLDQTEWTITKHNVESLEGVSRVFYDLLTRDLLPGVRIIVSSRECAAASLPRSAWIGDVVTLTGFSADDAKHLFNAITSMDDSDEVDVSAPPNGQAMSNWDILTKTSSALLPFVSIPAFLIFVAIVFKNYDTPPKNLTDLMAKVIENLKYSSNIQEDIWTITRKLKQLSYEAMQKGLVIFSESDLETCELSKENVKDLLFEIPQSERLSHRFIKGNSVFYFCHQSLQEFLAACVIVEMSLQDFKEFVQMKLNEDHWTVVRRFVCGLVFADSLNANLLYVSDRDERKQILRESLASRLKKAKHFRLLELYAAVYETDDYRLAQCITEIDLASLSRDVAYMIGSMLPKIRRLNRFILSGYGLADDLLNIAVSNMEDNKIRIKEVHFKSSNTTLAAFTNFLQFVIPEEIHIEHGRLKVEQNGLDWQIIQRLKIKDELSESEIILDNQRDTNVVKLAIVNRDWHDRMRNPVTSPIDVIGTYSKNDKRFNVDIGSSDWSFAIHFAEFVTYYLKPDSVLFNLKGTTPQYIYHPQLDSVIHWEAKSKIDEVVLNYFNYSREEDDDIVCYLHRCEDDISALVRKFQIKIVNIAINISDIGNIPNSLSSTLSRFGCDARIHVVQEIQLPTSLQELSHKLQHHQIEYLRLTIKLEGCPISQLVSLVKNLNDTKQIWIIDTSVGLSSRLTPESVQQEFREVARNPGVNIKIEQWKGFQRNDPWRFV